MTVKKIKIDIINDPNEFRNLPDDEKTNEYFKLVDQLKKIADKISKPDKNSKNSSKSPYTDYTRKHNTGKRKGEYGPPKGHEGVSRKISKNPDHTMFVPITHDPDTNEPVLSFSQSYQSHQVLEIEPIKLVVIEIQRQTTTINGRTVVAPNPEGIKDYDRIGPNLKSHVCYLHYELNTPWERIRKWFFEIGNDTIGNGTIGSIFEEIQKESNDDYEKIREDIRKAAIVGADETGIHVFGKKWWIHTFRTENETLFIADKSRGHTIATEALGKDFVGTIVSDFWGAYNPKFYGENTKFAKCMAHALRHIQYAVECENNIGDYAKQVVNVILDAIYLKKFFIFNTKEYKAERAELEQRFNDLLLDDVETATDEGRKLWKLFRKYRDHIFKFLYIEELPADNNGAERDIRDIVVAKKVSKAYRTDEGIKTLAQVKSITSTLRKRKENVFEYFRSIFGKFDFARPG